MDNFACLFGIWESKGHKPFHNSLCFIAKLHRFFLHQPSLLLTKFKGPPSSRKIGEKEEREAIRLCLLQQQGREKSESFSFPSATCLCFFVGKGGRGEGEAFRQEEDACFVYCRPSPPTPAMFPTPPSPNTHKPHTSRYTLIGEKRRRHMI